MAESPQSKWLRIPLVGMDRSGPSLVDGGTMDLVDAETRTIRGGLSARYEDVVYSDEDGEALFPAQYRTPRQIAQEQDAKTGRAVTVALARNTDGDIYGLLVRGHSDVSGDLIAGDPVLSGWTAPAEAQMQSEFGTVETDGRECRVHGSNPKYFGLPPAITREVSDFKFIERTDDRPALAHGGRSISQPFGEDNEIRAPLGGELSLHPSANQIGVETDQSLCQQLSPFPLFGSNTGAGGAWGMYEKVYYAASYLYDGTQESPLYLFPGVWTHVNDGSDTSAGIRSVAIALQLLGIKYDEDNQIVGTPFFPKRVRKIRLYAGLSNSYVSNPLQKLEFKLIQEIDIEKWDAQSTYSRYQLSVLEIDTDANTITAEVDTSYADVGATDSEEPMVEWGGSPSVDQGWRAHIEIQGEAGSLRARIESVGAYRTTDTTSTRIMVIHYNPADEAIVQQLLEGSGFRLTFPFVRARQAGGGNPMSAPFHLEYFCVYSSEILTHPSYTDLSGLPQTTPSNAISPGRRGGTSKTSRPVIWGTTDYLGVTRPNRIHRCMFSPAAVMTPDRFNPYNDYVDLDFVPLTIVSHRGLDAIFGRNQIELRALNDNMQRVSRSWRGIGAVSDRSVVSMPEGVFFLSDDGVRVLGGTEVSESISDPIADMLREIRDQWSNAIGGYHPRLSEYHLFIPGQTEKGGVGESGTTFIFSLVTKEWSRLSTPIAVTAMCQSVDGLLLAAKNDPQRDAHTGIWESQNSSEQMQGAEAEIRLVFGNHGFEKMVKRVRAFFVSAVGDPFAVDIVPEDEKKESYTVEPGHSGWSGEMVSIRDRMVTVTARNFARLEALEIEYDDLERSA